ncbi:MAG TPA: DUF1593 domain-containing protein [Ferrovibrio sp.]|uniref:DUF1593 domain-containing protein n=1 Tax=Ferrovibrio sp. TaxID=1917215 RepID=UPI002B4B9308|nr:DUF1593 domain-containing protein [Ferrovibrio sp.]HLT76798.1 DUF1593 domain-containing protein [Ferrovibrio sp.]
MPWLTVFLSAIAFVLLAGPALAADPRPRVVISTDIGGADPDDMQSLAHALLYADRIRLVGLISTPTGHGGRTADIHRALDAYEADYPLLRRASPSYPAPDSLRGIVHQGRLTPQPEAGFSEPSDGSHAIIAAGQEAAAAGEPLWVLLWGAATDLAQALHDAPQIARHLRVYMIGAWNTAQDRAARDYIAASHARELWWIENDSSFRGFYTDEQGRENNEWRMGEARGHGALGRYFTEARQYGLKMGDTPSLLYLIDSAPDDDPGDPSSWGGAFRRFPARGPHYWTDADVEREAYRGAATVRRHRVAAYRDFAARLDRLRAME